MTWIEVEANTPKSIYSQNFKSWNFYQVSLLTLLFWKYKSDLGSESCTQIPSRKIWIFTFDHDKNLQRSITTILLLLDIITFQGIWKYQSRDVATKIDDQTDVWCASRAVIDDDTCCMLSDKTNTKTFRNRKRDSQETSFLTEPRE